MALSLAFTQAQTSSSDPKSKSAMGNGAICRGPVPVIDRCIRHSSEGWIGPSIAILPFTNLSSDPEQEYFADGMVEDIITALSWFKALFVIAPRLERGSA